MELVKLIKKLTSNCLNQGFSNFFFCDPILKIKFLCDPNMCRLILRQFFPLGNDACA